MSDTDTVDAEQAAFDLADETAEEALGEVLHPWVVHNAALGSHALNEIVGYLIKAYVGNGGFEEFVPVDPVVRAGGSVEPF